MTKHYFTTIILVILCVVGIKAQTVYSDPSPLQESSQDVKIYFNAVGTRLEGVNANNKVYAHTGCDLSNGQTWQKAPSWGDNAEKYELVYVSENLWMLFIGDIRSYYGVTDANVNVIGLDFVFRTADVYSSDFLQTQDLFLDVYDDGLQITMLSNAKGEMLTEETAYVTFSVNTTEEADIVLSVNGETVESAIGAKSLKYSYLFPGVGEYTVTATATTNDEEVSATEKFYYLASSQEMDYPGGTPRMGPVKNEDGSVTFCFGAPEKEHVVLVGSWNGYEYSSDQVMKYQDIDGLRYFWTTVDGLDDETMYVYYFIVDGEYTVGDPYARLVLDPYNDKYLNTNVFPNLPEYPWDKVINVPLAIYQGNINDYDWQVDDFVGVPSSDLIIYELLFRDFTGTEGKANGNGTVRQAIEKFPYLLELGVNAIELLPIMEFSGNQSWGYNPNFYFAVDKAYGTPDDYKEFIDLCHQNGIAVILDMVFNQTDGLHPWYQMYEIGKNPFYNLDAPHAYSVLNDWNQGMPMVQEQFADVIRYWMTEYKFDGFRFDLVKGLGNNDSYANNGDAATNAYNQSRVDRMKALQEVVNSINPNAYFINENLAGAQEENAMAEFGQLNWANVNDAGCQFAMGYPSGSNLNRMYAPKDSRLWGSTVSYLESHDEQRLAYKQDMWGVAGVKGNVENSMRRLGAAAAQMILAPGAHMIWQFSEMGNAQNTKTDQGNDVSPKIVNWSLLDEPNHYGLYQNYSELIAIRNMNPELFSEEAQFTNNCGESDWVKGRTLISTYGDQQIITVINPNVEGSLVVNVDFTKAGETGYGIISKSYNTNPSFNIEQGTVTVPANSYVSISTYTLAGVDELGKDFDSLRVQSSYGAIHLENIKSKAMIYSLDGRKVAELKKDGSVNLTPGIYIVNGDGQSFKIAVR